MKTTIIALSLISFNLVSVFADTNLETSTDKVIDVMAKSSAVAKITFAAANKVQEDTPSVKHIINSKDFDKNDEDNREILNQDDLKENLTNLLKLAGNSEGEIKTAGNALELALEVLFDKNQNEDVKVAVKKIIKHNLNSMKNTIIKSKELVEFDVRPYVEALNNKQEILKDSLNESIQIISDLESQLGVQ